METNPKPSLRRTRVLAVGASILLALYALRPQAALLSLAALGFVQWTWFWALRNRTALARILLLGISTTAALFLGEFLALWRWPITPYRLVASEGSEAEGPYLPDPVLGRVHAPNFTGRFLHPEYDAAVFATNSEGFRGAEWPTAKEAGEVRVLLLGDSATVGFGVRQEETISAQLEVLLKERFPGARTFNAAVAGYGPRHELLLLERLAPRLQPTHVIVVFYDGNDLQNCLDQFVFERKAGLHNARLPSEGPGPDVTPTPQRPPSMLSRWYWSHKSALYHRLETAWMPWLTERGIFKHHAYRGILARSKRDPLPNVQEELDLAQEALLAMAKRCDALGAEFLVVRMPMRLQTELASFAQITRVYGEDPSALDRTRPGRTLLEACSSAGLSTLNLLPAFEIPGRGPNDHYYEEGHPNAKGNRVTAELLAERLGRN